MMQDQNFDFNLFEAIINNPKALRHKTDGHFLVYDEKGKDVYVQISDAQSENYPIYRADLDRYCLIQKQFTTLNGDIETFRNYDINESKTKQTIGGKSLFNKLRGHDVVAAKKPPEPGEE